MGHGAKGRRYEYDQVWVAGDGGLILVFSKMQLGPFFIIKRCDARGIANLLVLRNHEWQPWPCATGDNQ